MSNRDAAPLMKWDVSSSVLSISISYDGKHIATGSHDGYVRVWDVRTGGLVLGTLKGHDGSVLSVAYSPDNTRIVSGSDDCTICTWNASNGTAIGQNFHGHTSTIRSVAFSPDNSRIVSGSSDCTIRIWDSQTATSIGNLPKIHTKSISSVAFSPNSALVISGSYDHMICIWDSSTGNPMGKLQGHTDIVRSVAFSPDNSQVISGSSDCTIRMWDIHTRTPIDGPLSGHTQPVNSVAFSPDHAYIISGSDDRTVCIWDARTRAPIGQPLQMHTGSVQSVAFSPDSAHVISGSLDSTVCIWSGLRDALLAPQNSQLSNHVSSKMTMREMFDSLVKHGCIDLSASVDATRHNPTVFASGGFGDVWSAVLINDTRVAIKTLKQQHLQGSDRGTKRAAREMYIWSKLRHPNVQALLGIVIFQGELGMVSPWMEHGNLAKYLLENPNVERYGLCVQLTSGVSYLHDSGIVHGDLKASNVLVSKDGKLKINDFDHAILSESTLRFSTVDRTGGGTLRWMAPELFQAEGEEEDEKGETQPVAARTKHTDVYALGMTMLEIITGTVPYSEYRNNEGAFTAIIRKIPPKRPKVLLKPEGEATEMWNLLLRCWNHEPSARPITSSVYTSVFVLAARMRAVQPKDPLFDVITSKMSTQEMFECLVKHGCVDMSSSLDTSRRSITVIASGGFGDVWQVNTTDGSLVAVKTLRLQTFLQGNDKGAKRAVREVYHWSKLRHPNIQELLGVVVFQGGLGMVSPWMKLGNLQRYIAQHPTAGRYPFCVQLAAGVSYMHGINMVHGDLKANNVLVSEDGILKINDFDHAILSENTLRFSTETRPGAGGGELRWMAPELFQPEDEETRSEALVPRSKQTDIYALGMTMLEVITGAVPYAEYRTDAGVCGAIFRKQAPRRPKQLLGPGARETNMWALMLQCWDHESEARPDASSVFEYLSSTVVDV